ncbi:MAG: hypothetical protein QW607_06960 [Desulfurococcaceae archaeon]
MKRGWKKAVKKAKNVGLGAICIILGFIGLGVSVYCASELIKSNPKSPLFVPLFLIAILSLGLLAYGFEKLGIRI